MSFLDEISDWCCKKEDELIVFAQGNMPRSHGKITGHQTCIVEGP